MQLLRGQPGQGSVSHTLGRVFLRVRNLTAAPTCWKNNLGLLFIKATQGRAGQGGTVNRSGRQAGRLAGGQLARLACWDCLRTRAPGWPH